jgi:hypothetical protein
MTVLRDSLGAAIGRMFGGWIAASREEKCPSRTIKFAALPHIGRRTASVSPRPGLSDEPPDRFDTALRNGLTRQNVAFPKPGGKGVAKARESRASNRRKSPQRLEKPTIGV